MDWKDFEKVIVDLNLHSLSDMYKWMSVLYQFGIAMPVSILRKVLSGFDQNEFYNFQDFFKSDEYENLPVILEGATLRARHELIAQWYVEKNLTQTIHQRLGDILKVAHLDNALERSVFTSLLGRKNIVRHYFTKLHQTDLEILRQKAVEHRLSHRIVMMMIGWLQVAKHEYTSARDTFKTVVEEHPTFLPAILEAGKIEFFLGNESEAERLLNKCIAISPSDLNSRTELAKVYQVQKEYEKAEASILEELLKLEPKTFKLAQSWPKSIKCRRDMGRQKADLEDLLKLDPKNLQARTELAKVYQAQKRYDEAEKVLKECIQLSSDLNSRTELAKVYQAQNRYDEAERVLKEALAIDANQLHPRTELAKVYQAQGRYGEAESILEELLKLDAENLQARTELAKVYQAQKRYGQAEKILNEALAIDANQLQPRTELAKVYQVQKEYEKAEAILEDLLKLDPKNLQARTELAKVYQVQKEYEKAEAILEELYQ